MRLGWVGMGEKRETDSMSPRFFLMPFLDGILVVVGVGGGSLRRRLVMLALKLFFGG